jgi:conjugative transfer signal peptidase TraF
MRHVLDFAKRAYVGILAAIIFLGGTAYIMHALGVRFVITDSVPRGAYIREPATTPVRGDFVFVCIDVKTINDAVNRGVLPAFLLAGGHGDCPNGVLPIVKRVVAVAGDRVDVSDNGISVNGSMIAESAPLSRAAMGMRPGSRVLSPDELWLAGRGPRSWDSRYFGPAQMHVAERERAIATVDAVALPLVLVDHL